MLKVKTSKYKLISFFSIIIFLIILAFLGYSSSSRISNFELACQKLGFHQEEQQDALLTAFNDFGYFTPEILWQDINNIGFKDPQKVFNQINKVITISNTIEKNNDLGKKKKYLRKNLLQNTSEENAVELIVWWGQNSFNRRFGVERVELPSDALMIKRKERLKFMDKLGISLKEASIPENSYDVVWIMGANRTEMYRRLNFYKKNKHVIQNNPKVFVLVASNRELFAELDGLLDKQKDLIPQIELEQYNSLGYNISKKDSRVEDGIKYIIYLANKEKIPLEKEKQIIKYNSKDECPEGRLPNRSYPNYEYNYCGTKITEKEMAQDLISHLSLDEETMLIYTSNSCFTLNQNGASSIETSTKAAKVFVQQMLEAGSTSANLLIISSNPYLARQSTIAEREMRKATNEIGHIKIKVDKAGFGLQEDDVNFHVLAFELGGLIMERYRNHLFNLNLEEINIENMVSKLSFVSREEKYNKSYKPTPLSIFDTIKIFLSVNPFNLLFNYI